MRYRADERDRIAVKARRAYRAATAVIPFSADDCASRSYYAVFHALRYRLGRDLPEHGDAYAPDTVAAAGLAASDGADVQVLYNRRITADYRPHHVTAADSAASVATAAKLFSRLGIPT